MKRFFLFVLAFCAVLVAFSASSVTIQPRYRVGDMFRYRVCECRDGEIKGNHISLSVQSEFAYSVVSADQSGYDFDVLLKVGDVKCEAGDDIAPLLTQTVDVVKDVYGVTPLKLHLNALAQPDSVLNYSALEEDYLMASLLSVRRAYGADIDDDVWESQVKPYIVDKVRRSLSDKAMVREYFSEVGRLQFNGLRLEEGKLKVSDIFSRDVCAAVQEIDNLNLKISTESGGVVVLHVDGERATDSITGDWRFVDDVLQSANVLIKSTVGGCQTTTYALERID